jgi:hypothetical protein
MAMSIPSPAKCEVRAVILFLYAKRETAAEINGQLVSLYGEDVMSRQNMAKWCCKFEAGKSDVRDKIKSGRPSIVTDDIIQKNDENIRAERCLTIDELRQQCLEVSRTVLHEIVTERLGYRKLCARWVCCTITPVHILLMPRRCCCSP